MTALHLKQPQAVYTVRIGCNYEGWKLLLTKGHL